MHMAGLGAGADLDPAATVALFRQSAQQGYAPAELGLGRAYRAGAGITADRGQAVHWYRLAAAQNDLTAKALYGLALLTGDNVSRDESRGRALVEEAHRQGDVIALLINSALTNPDGPPTATQLNNLSDYLAKM